MLSIGIRELKQKTSAILQRVRDKGEEVQVTYRGEVVARIVPVRTRKPDRRIQRNAVWADWDQLAAEISAEWQGSASGADAVSEGRREL